MKRAFFFSPIVCLASLAPAAAFHGCGGGVFMSGDGLEADVHEEEPGLDPVDAALPDPDVAPEPPADLSADEDAASEPDEDVPEAPVLPYWIRSVGMEGSEHACCIDLSSDGLITVAGSTRSFRGGDENFWVMTFDLQGTCLWQKYYGGDFRDEAYSLLRPAGGGLLVAGLSTFFNGNCMFLRLDDRGDVEWQKMYLPVHEDMGFIVRQPAAGGFMAVGKGWGSLWAVRLEDSGRTLWMRTYTDGGHPSVHAGQPLPEGGMVFAGKISFSDDGGEDILLLKMDGSGSILWQKILAGPGHEEALGLHLLPEGHMILVGTVQEHPDASPDALVMRLDPSGGLLWARALGGEHADEARDVAPTSEGDLVVAGSTASFGMGQDDAWIMKMNAAGGLLWQRTYGGTGRDEVRAVKITPPGIIAAAGATESFGAGESDVWILYLGPGGEVPLGCPAGLGLQSSAPVRDLVLDEMEAGFLSEPTMSLVIETDVVPVDTDARVRDQCAP